MSLTKGMYYNGGDVGRFGLYMGQVRHKEIVHNGTWYNGQGEKLGWGDLGAQDIIRISKELEAGELFITVREYPSYWGLPKDVDSEAPGLAFCRENCTWIIKPGEIFYADDYRDKRVDWKLNDEQPVVSIPRSEVDQHF